MIGCIITCDADVAKGAAELAMDHPLLAMALAQTEPLPLRLREGGFEALLSAIVSQQISVAAAAAIWERLRQADMITAAAINAATDDEIRACGMSRPKVIYARSLAQSAIDYEALKTLPTDEVLKTLIAVKGIGRWSADIYAMFSLGRADVFAAGDLALQESAKILFDLKARPNEAQMREMAIAWSPWQSVAARILWAYYRVIKQREGLS